MPRSSKPDQPKAILIVEDNPDFCDLLKFVVEDDGYEGVQFPIDQGNIVEWAKEHQVLTVLMDLTLRRKPGMEYVEELKNDKDTKHIPIVIITGKELPSREILALQMRDIKYLRKGRMELDDIRAEIKKSAESAAPKTGAKKKKKDGVGE